MEVRAKTKNASCLFLLGYCRDGGEREERREKREKGRLGKRPVQGQKRRQHPWGYTGVVFHTVFVKRLVLEIQNRFIRRTINDSKDPSQSFQVGGKSRSFQKFKTVKLLPQTAAEAVAAWRTPDNSRMQASLSAWRWKPVFMHAPWWVVYAWEKPISESLRSNSKYRKWKAAAGVKVKLCGVILARCGNTIVMVYLILRRPNTRVL